MQRINALDKLFAVTSKDDVDAYGFRITKEKNRSGRPKPMHIDEFNHGVKIECRNSFSSLTPVQSESFSNLREPEVTTAHVAQAPTSPNSSQRALHVASKSAG